MTGIDPYPWGNLASLRAAADNLTGAIRHRCAVENRVTRGGGALDPGLAAETLAAARDLEELYREILMSAYTTQIPPAVRDWAACIPGLSTGVLFPRIIGTIGHPRIAIPWTWDEGAPAPVPAGPPYLRTRHQQLWQYCGCGDPRTRPAVLGHRPDRAELMRAGKLKTVRSLLYTFSASLVRQHTRSEVIAASAYYKIFTDAREQAAGHDGRCVPGGWPSPCAGTHNRHEYTCRNTRPAILSSNGCGIVAHPEWGEPGTPWRPGHLTMHAHRVLHKEFLLDLWRVSAR